MLTIAVDAMGGDFAPRAVIEGIGEALDLAPNTYKLFVVGCGEEFKRELARINKLDHPSLTLVEADEVVHMDDPPAAAMRTKRRSSINLAVDLVKSGDARAVVSAGNTGAVVASTVVKLRTLAGLERPAIAAVMPSTTGRFLLLDAGANVDCKPIHLVHYAIMGDAYARHILQIRAPRIGLLNVGGEDSKGNELTKGTFKRLGELPDINFIGNVEGHDLFAGKVDVVVCDGFVGNIVLKCSESLAKALTEIMSRNLNKNLIRQAGAVLARNAFRELKRISDQAGYGGAPLLGVNGVCIIGHGASSPRAIRNLIRVAGEYIELEVNREISARVHQLKELHESPLWKPDRRH